MNQELEFAKTLEGIRALAKEQNNTVSKEQVEEAFAKIGMKDAQLELVYEYLKNKKIGIGEPVNLDEYLTGEDVNYLELYLEELQSLCELSDGEKYAITMGAMAGDVDDQRKLLESYLKEVVEIAKLYAGQGVLVEDLIGEGNVALTMGVTMLGCLEHPSEAEGMLGKMIMDAMEEYIIRSGESDETYGL
ncbi:MAG: hypothetical protein R3Y24_01775 [Eubacteriales bacterium]